MLHVLHIFLICSYVWRGEQIIELIIQIFHRPFTSSFLDQVFSEPCFQETLCFRQYKKNVWPFVTILATKPFIGFLMQFGVGIHHRRLNKREFRENRRRESYFT